jgi:hypothetical protein
MFVLIDCPAESGAAEMSTADERKMAVSPERRKCLCCGTGRQNQLFKCNDVTVENMENKHLEDSPSSDGWNSFSPKLNAWCALSRHEVIGPFFFQEKAVNSTKYLYILELFAVLQMAHLQPHVFFQQDVRILG